MYAGGWWGEAMATQCGLGDAAAQQDESKANVWLGWRSNTAERVEVQRLG